MFDIMYARYILTIAALIVIILMDVLYFTKPKANKKLKHKMFSYLIIANTIVLLAEICIMTLFWLDLPFGICVISLKIRDYVLMSYFTILMFYYYTASSDTGHKTLTSFIKNEKIVKPHLIFTAIVMIVEIFLPYKVVDKNTFNTAFGGLAFYLTIMYSVISTLETIYIILIKNKNQKDFSVKLSLVWLFVVMILILLSHMIFYDISSMGLLSSIYILVLYFIFENPELELIEEIDSLTAEVDNANKSKLDFLSNVSKEMISPMKAISDMSEKILNDKECNDETIRNNIKQIELSSKNFLEIINNTLDISNAEKDSETLNENDYSLKKLLKSLTNITREKLIGKNVELKLNIDETVPNNLYGDSTKIYQVLLNVISNSVKYTDIGKIAITLTKEIKNAKIILKFKISDSGYGIKEEDYDKIFVKYSRLEEAVENGIEGSGLGLAISKQYVDLLEGKIWFDSEYGAGTNFYIEIPQQVIAMTPTIGSFSTEEEGNKNNKEKLDCSNYRILIVEDDRTNSGITKRLFERYKFNIDTCNSGKDCIYKYKLGEKYDMILIDYNMSGTSGPHIMHVIRKLVDYTTPPLIAFTTNAYSGTKDMSVEEESFDDFLEKPIDLNELDTLINKYFNKKEADI